MASFTDTRVPQFNPYIPTIPVDAYTKVGMFKQGQYNQNLERINNTVEAIDNLPVDASFAPYINKRLDDLRKQVNSSISGDLSNQQLTNNILQSARVIVKDPIIKNAISSTRAVQNALSQASEAKTSGKGYSPSNEAFLQKQISDWRDQLQSGNLNAQFNGSYTPFSDYNKHVLDALKDAGVESIDSDPYVYEKNAQGVMEKKINPAIIKSSGLSPARVNAIVSNALTEADKQQLAIDGWYAYRGIDTKGMMSIATSQYDKEISGLNDEINKLKNVDSKFNPNDATYQQSVQDQLKSATDRLAKVTTERSKYVEQNQQNIEQNLDSFKSRFYTTSYLYNAVKGYSHISQEYKTNPIAQFEMQQQRLQLAYDKLLKGTKNGNGDDNNSVGPTLAPGFAAGSVAPTPTDIITSAKESVEATNKQVNDLYQQIKKAYGLSDQSVMDAINEYKKGNKPQGPLQDDLNSLIDLTNEANRKSFQFSQIVKDADTKFAPDLQKALEDTPSFTFNNKTYSPQELIQFASLLDDWGGKFTTVDGVRVPVQSEGKDFKPINNQDEELFRVYGSMGGGSLQGIVDKISSKTKSVSNDKRKYISNQISDIMSIGQSTYSPVEVNQSKEKEEFANLLNNYAISQTEGGKKLQTSVSGKHFDYDDAMKMLSDSNTHYGFMNDGSGNYYYVISNAKVGKDNYLPATREQVMRLTPNFISPEQSVKEYYNKQLRAGGGYTTNIEGMPLFTFSKFDGMKNQSNTGYHVTGDLIKGVTSGKYAIQLHVSDKNNPQVKNRPIVIFDPGGVSLTDNNLGSVEEAIRSLTPEMITKLLYHQGE